MATIPHYRKRFISFSLILRNSHRVTYRGVTCRKFPTDYVLIQIAISRVQPDLIIEIGTNHGGSALYFADLQSTYNHEAQIHTIDVVDLVTDDTIISDPRICRFLGGFENYDLSNVSGFKNIMVVDDGSHSADDVLACLEKFSTVVTPGSYFVVEDGGLSYMGWDRYYSGGPCKAIRKFLKSNDEFVVDEKLETLFGPFSSNNPRGYLRRKEELEVSKR